MNSLWIDCLVLINFAEFWHCTYIVHTLYHFVPIVLDHWSSPETQNIQKNDPIVAVQVKVATSPKFELFGYDFMARIGRVGVLAWALLPDLQSPALKSSITKSCTEIDRNWYRIETILGRSVINIHKWRPEPHRSWCPWLELKTFWAWSESTDVIPQSNSVSLQSISIFNLFLLTWLWHTMTPVYWVQ